MKTVPVGIDGGPGVDLTVGGPGVWLVEGKVCAGHDVNMRRVLVITSVPGNGADVGYTRGVDMNGRV